MKTQNLFIILFLIYGFSSAQTKIEFERRIPLDSFPKQAQITLSKMPSDLKKVRFYEETSGEDLSYEAKFKFRKKHYSVEFSKEGVLQDVEVNVKKSRIDPSLTKIMEEPFKKDYTKFRWLKVQEQYNYDGQTSEMTFILEVLNGKSCCLPFYEIVAEVKKDRSFFLKEYNFNEQGLKLSDRVIDPESYAHVLY
jgi:hypothetical protein